MAHPQRPESDSAIYEYYVPAEDTHSRNTNEEVNIMQQRQAGTTRTSEANFEFHTPSRNGYFFSNEQDLSASSEDGFTNSDFCVDIARAITSEIESDSRFCNINPEFKNMEEPHSHPGMQLLGFVGNEINSTTGQNIASTMEISENKNLPDKILDPGATSENNSFGNDIGAVSGSSRSNETVLPASLYVNMFPSTSSLNQHTEVETKKKVSCEFCIKVIAEHFHAFESNSWYICCICNFKCDREDDLLNHINDHTVEKIYCDICNNDRLEPELHGILQDCNRCEKSFQCRHLLEDHYIIHELHHYKYCRVCNREITQHAKRMEKLNYECCKCGHILKNAFYLREHLYNHSDLMLFKCGECGYPFKHKRGLSSHSKTHK